MAAARELSISDDDFDTLARKSDVVMIGHVLAVQDTSEETTLPNIAPEIHVRGVETKFCADTALRGEVANKVVVFHHYRLRDPSQRFRSGPLLVRFVVNAHRHYLLFLKREPDVAPAGGQTDPALSVRRVMGAFDGLNQMAKEEETDAREAKHQPERLKESPDAPIQLRSVQMETQDGVRKGGKMKVINKKDKDIVGYKVEAMFFKADGSIADNASMGVYAAVGNVVVPAHGETYTTVRGRYTDNDDTSRAEAVVSSVEFAGGSRWEAKQPPPEDPGGSRTTPQSGSPGAKATPETRPG